MGSAPITQALIDQVRAAFPKAAISNGYGTTEAGPVVFGPHPDGLPQPELSTGYPHPGSAAAAGARRTRGRGRGRAGDEVRRADDALSQAARGDGQGDDAGRLLPHRRRVPPRRRTASSSSSAGPTTCSCAAARTSIPARSRRCWSAIPASTRPRSSRARRAQGPQADGLRRARHGADARRAGGQGLRARQRAGLSASAPA